MYWPLFLSNLVYHDSHFWTLQLSTVLNTLTSIQGHSFGEKAEASALISCKYCMLPWHVALLQLVPPFLGGGGGVRGAQSVFKGENLVWLIWLDIPSTLACLIMIIALKGAIWDFFFFTMSWLRRQLSPTRMLKWPGRSHVQHIKCLSCATCWLPLGTKGLLSY